MATLSSRMGRPGPTSQVDSELADISNFFAKPALRNRLFLRCSSAQVRPGRGQPAAVVVVADPDPGDVVGPQRTSHRPPLASIPECWRR